MPSTTNRSMQTWTHGASEKYLEKGNLHKRHDGEEGERGHQHAHPHCEQRPSPPHFLFSFFSSSKSSSSRSCCCSCCSYAAAAASSCCCSVLVRCEHQPAQVPDNGAEEAQAGGGRADTADGDELRKCHERSELLADAVHLVLQQERGEE